MCVYGHFAFGQEKLNGQTVKTKILADTLQEVFGSYEVMTADTHGGIKMLLKIPVQCWNMLRSCYNIVILPAQNGLRVIAPILVIMNLLFRRKLHYVVIGGWLPAFLKKRWFLARILRFFDSIYIETSVMQTALKEQGFCNLYVMPNCKNLNPLLETELIHVSREPYRLCTFSRVMEEKGIGDAVAAVKSVNERFGRTVYTLDIYGQVDNRQEEWFDCLQNTFAPGISYKGSVPYSQSTQVLKEYFALLFPTHFYTEGVPGTLIDAYSAGVPVICSRWESFADVVDDGVTGVGIPFGRPEALAIRLTEIAQNPGQLLDMRVACLKKAATFLPEYALEVLIKNINARIK